MTSAGRPQGGLPLSNIDKQSSWPPSDPTLSTGNNRHLDHRQDRYYAIRYRLVMTNEIIYSPFNLCRKDNSGVATGIFISPFCDVVNLIRFILCVNHRLYLVYLFNKNMVILCLMICHKERKCLLVFLYVLNLRVHRRRPSTMSP